jgi:hypothetical protein
MFEENLDIDELFEDEEIENLLAKERERQTANLAQVADLLASIRTDPNKLLGGTPNIFCKGGSPGIITMEQMPSLQENLNSATNYVFNMYATTFMKELLTYQSALLSQQKTLNTTAPVLQKFVTLTIIDKDGALQVLENTINSVFSQKVAQGTYELCNKDGNTDIDSLINAYPGAVDQTAVDIQKVLNISNIDDLKEVIQADNIYILNYNTKQVIATELFDEQYGLINDGNVSTYKKTALGYRWLNDLISTNTSDMSISINLPTKFSLFNDTTTAPNYNIVPSSDNIVVNTHGTGIVLSASLNEFITTFTGSLSDYSIDRTGV